MKLTWKDIPDYEGLYKASNLGDIFSVRTNKVMKPQIQKNRGYLLIQLTKDNKKLTKRIQRVIMETFIGPSELQVNHKNGIKTDNRLENLEYCTNQQNIQHAYDHNMINSRKGESCHLSKLTEKEVIEIKKLIRSGLSQTRIAKLYDVTSHAIHCIAHGKSWTHIKLDNI